MKVKVAAALVVALAVFGIALVQPASAALSIRVVSSSQYGPDEFGNTHIVGEVVNDGDQVADFVRINVSLKNAAGTVLDTDFTFTTLRQVGPGEKSPFKLRFSPPAGYSTYSLAVDPSAGAAAPNHNFTVTATGSFVDGDGNRHLTGQVTNDNTTLAEQVQVVATFYNGTPVVTGTEFTAASSPAAALEPGETAPWESLLAPDVPAYANYALVGESTSPPNRVAPSPTGSASPQPTASPTASDRPAPPNAPQAPTLSAPTTATAGVVVVVFGTAQAGAVVELWGVTAPNATITRVNTPTVTADANGSWSKTIRPLRNVNLQARVGSLSSATRFIAVKTAVRQSVAALAGCIVQVSGAVFEPKPGRTVFIRAIEAGRAVSVGTGVVQSDGRFLLRKPYACGRTLDVYTVIEGDAVNRPGATGTQRIVTRR